MKQNVGILDSTLRVTIGFALLGVAFIVPAPLKYLAFAGFLTLPFSLDGGICHRAAIGLVVSCTAGFAPSTFRIWAGGASSRTARIASGARHRRSGILRRQPRTPV